MEMREPYEIASSWGYQQPRMDQELHPVLLASGMAQDLKKCQSIGDRSHKLMHNYSSELELTSAFFTPKKNPGGSAPWLSLGL